MITLYLRQAWAMMRHNRLFSSMYILGTAVTIAIVMIFFIIIYIKLGPIYPEYNRDRLLYLELIHFEINNGNSSGYTGASRHLYEKLNSVEGCDAVATSRAGENLTIEGLKNGTLLFASHSFWQIFDFEFIGGRAFTKQDEENNTAAPVIVISDKMAQQLFATVDAVGKEVKIQNTPHKVIGVVKGVSGSTPSVYADCWIPVNSSLNVERSYTRENILGRYKLFFLVSRGKDFETVKSNISNQFSRFAQEQPKGNKYEPYINTHIKYMLGNEYGAQDFGFMLLLFMTLLFIPALNLSGMIASRMNSRMEEIGVRKAFGATNRTLVSQVLFENLLFTAIGALFGLLLAYIFALLTQEWIVTLLDSVNMNANYPTEVTMEMLINPTVVVVTILLILLLNLVSALIPTIYSLRHSITVSLNHKK